MAGKQVSYGVVYPEATTGGGGGGGGGGYFDASMIEADLTDGSWLLYDPSSLIKNVSFDGTRNVITVNAVNSGSNAALNWKNSGTRNAPRCSTSNVVRA